MCLHGQLGCYCPTNMCATGCQAVVSEVWMKCTTLMMHGFLVVFTVYCTVQHVASFAIRSFCSVCDANQVKSKAVLLSDIIIYQTLYCCVILQGQRQVVLEDKPNIFICEMMLLE